MFQPQAKWIDEGDSMALMWGHIKVGEVSLCGNGSWAAYYNSGRGSRFECLKDFPALDLAQREVERALAKAAEPQ